MNVPNDILNTRRKSKRCLNYKLMPKQSGALILDPGRDLKSLGVPRDCAQQKALGPVVKYSKQKSATLTDLGRRGGPG